MRQPFRLPARLPTLLRGFGLLPILAAIFVFAPLFPAPPGSVRWHGTPTVAMEVGATLLLMVLLCRPWPGADFVIAPSLRQVSLLCMHLLFVWALVSCLRAPNPFAVQGLLTLGFGVLTADVVAAQVTDQRRMTFFVFALLGAGVLVCGFSLAALGRTEPLAFGSLHDHQLFGAFLAIPLLLSLALSFGGGSQAQRLAGQAALLLCLAGLWESQARSAWLGVAAALLVFAALSAFMAGRKAIRPGVIVPVLLVLAAMLGVVLLLPRDKVLARVQSYSGGAGSARDSLRWREAVWAGTRRMIREKPLWGWGIGSFPATHQPWTGTGHRPGEVYADGPSIEDEAHNSYLQTWAELGGAGLVLWTGALGAFLIAGVRALPRYPARSPAQWVLVGCLSAIAGQMVDACANPAWQFGPVLLPLWGVLGLTAALTRPGEAGHRQPRRLVSVPVVSVPAVSAAAVSAAARFGQALLAAGVGAGLLWLIFSTAFALPAPHL